MEHPPPPTTVLLQPIWERVFRRSPIGMNEDFFELGGDARLATELFAEIRSNLAPELPPAAICTASTIAKLAASLDAAKPCLPAFLLKDGPDQAPVFMFHGIGSSVIDLVPLARRMQSAQPIYGLEARGNDGKQEPFERVEEMADFFLPVIREIQPRGPYFLIGYSFGGLVAFEIARRLRAEADEIGLLAMLDSYPDRHHLPIAQHVRLLLRAAGNRLSHQKSSGQPPNVGPGGQLRPIGDRVETRNSLALAMQRVKDAQYRALRNYRPVFYDGSVKFVRAAVPTRFPADPVPVWSPLVSTLQVDAVAGGHLGMLTTSVDQLASLLDKYVANAMPRTSIEHDKPSMVQSRNPDPH